MSAPSLNRVFWLAILLHVSFWSFVPPFFLGNYRPDTMEMMVIGQNWVLSTLKHPAFQGWIVEIYSILFRRAEFVPYLAAQTACLITVYFTWRLARRVLPEHLAVLAALALLSYYYLHFDSTLYNNRTFMRSFWVVTVYYWFLALKENRYRYWILSGMALGIGLYCKFTIFLLIATILLYMVLDSGARKYWKTPGPYLSTIACFLVFLPLLVWAVRHGFPMFSHVEASIGDSTPTVPERNESPLRFLLKQIPSVLILLIPVFPVIGFRWKWKRKKLVSTLEGRFLLGIVCLPIALQLMIAAAFAGDMRTALGCHLWLFLPTLLLYGLEISRDRAGRTGILRSRFGTALKIVFVNIFVFALLSVVFARISPFWTGRASRIHFPGRQLAENVDSFWRQRFSTPLSFVRGADWPCECVNVYLGPHPTLYSPLWSDEEEFRKRGGVLLWMEPDSSGRFPGGIKDSFANRDFRLSPKTRRPDDWLATFPEAEILSPLEIAPQTPVEVPRVRVGIAIVPPKNARAVPQRDTEK